VNFPNCQYVRFPAASGKNDRSTLHQPRTTQHFVKACNLENIMAEWLRPVFSRAKTPVPGVTATFERQTSSSIDESLPDIEEVPNSKLRPSSRVSSYIGFPVRPSTPPFPGVQEAFQNARDPEFLYHKPSGDQMAETLKVVMMTRYNIHPLPVQYNSCILHVLEAYQDLREQVDAKDKIIEQLTQDHTKDIQTFEELATKWEFKVGGSHCFPSAEWICLRKMFRG
jgi:hypothetical protein